ncbi:MAG TPA: galactitol-1-phosphate 5-dehydrogenase, partial [Thermogutta sp.]|nr:galactitol-1-phosphate 5-dehydrogenase [Thermogutta sp.]
MKALVLTEYHHLEVRDVPTPKPGPGELLVRVQTCGICGSDVHGLDGSTGRRKPPLIMGHEAAGVVAEVGPEVTRFRSGDRVTFDSTVYCGQCAYCLRGQINLCDNRRVLGVSCDEYRRDGAFAEYVVVPERIVYRLPENVSFQQAAMIEPLSVALHAVDRAAPKIGETAVIFGGGIIGLLILQVLRSAGLDQIITIEPDPHRQQMAKEFAADLVLSPEQFRQTAPPPVDLAFDAVGINETVNGAVNAVAKGGRVVLVGNLQPEVPLPLQKVVTRELTLLGSCASQGDYPRCLNLLAKQAVRVEPLISAVAPLEEGPYWFDQLYYRRWMHELPPLIHAERDRMIDVHHAILPLTHRIRPDMAAMLADARPLPERAGLAVLAPV